MACGELAKAEAVVPLSAELVAAVVLEVADVVAMVV
jgi:hypothetical protein